MGRLPEGALALPADELPAAPSARGGGEKQVPVSDWFSRPVKLQAAPAALPLHAAIACGGGPRCSCSSPFPFCCPALVGWAIAVAAPRRSSAVQADLSNVDVMVVAFLHCGGRSAILRRKCEENMESA